MLITLTAKQRHTSKITAYAVLFLYLCFSSALSRSETYTIYENLKENEQDIFESTSLYDLKQGSELSDNIYSFRNVSYESSLGDAINLKNFYKTNCTDLSLTWITKLDKNFGLIWGGSTGEYGEKYTIYPKFKFGFVFQTFLSKNSKLSMYATSYLGGMLKEKTCQADYGDIGGVQTVNCRLAGSTLQPA